jgi:hypothetical protein
MLPARRFVVSGFSHSVKSGCLPNSSAPAGPRRPTMARRSKNAVAEIELPVSALMPASRL